MSTRVEIPEFFHGAKCCCGCDRVADIEMHGYAMDGADIMLCRWCALQLLRKLAEDLCALDGARHG